MTNIKTGIFALATLFGVGSAFTTAPKTPVKQTGMTYFSVTNGSGGYNWSTSKGSLSCRNSTVAPYCTVITNGSGQVPQQNQDPVAAGFATGLHPGQINR